MLETGWEELKAIGGNRALQRCAEGYYDLSSGFCLCELDCVGNQIYENL